MTRIVRGVQFSASDRELVEVAFGGFGGGGIGGVDDQGRDRVRLHYNRIVKNAGGAAARDEDDPHGYAGELYFQEDLHDLLEVCAAMIERFEPQTSAAWWREQGAPGADDAVEGLAAGRAVAVANVEILRACAVEWLGQVHGVLV